MLAELITSLMYLVVLDFQSPNAKRTQTNSSSSLHWPQTKHGHFRVGLGGRYKYTKLTSGNRDNADCGVVKPLS